MPSGRRTVALRRRAEGGRDGSGGTRASTVEAWERRTADWACRLLVCVRRAM